MKKGLSLFIAALFILISLSSDSYAMTTENNNETFTADQASEELTDFVESLGVNIDQIEKFQIISNATTRSADTVNALMITTSQENTKQVYVIAGFQDVDGEIVPSDVVKPSETLTRTTKGYTWIPSTNTISVAASVGFNTYGTDNITQAYYNPYYCQVFYANTSGQHSVSYISAKYRSVGTPYSYPGFQPLSSSTYLHAIDVNQYSPVEWQIYSKTNYYSSGPSKVLRITIPSYSEAMGLELSVTVDGNSYSQYYGVTP